MQEPHGRAPSYRPTYGHESEHQWSSRSEWPRRITLGVVVALAAVGIPMLSLHLDDTYHETLVMIEHAKIDTVDEIHDGVQSPAALKHAADHGITPRDRLTVRNQLGFGAGVPQKVVDQRLRKYAADFKNGTFKRVPVELKVLAIERYGLERLLALKERMLRMNLSEDQMIAFAKRELGAATEGADSRTPRR